MENKVSQQPTQQVPPVLRRIVAEGEKDAKDPKSQGSFWHAEK